MPPTDLTELRICWNCREVVHIKVLCLDCWRMALITFLVATGGGEALHHIAERFGFLKW
jgi:hypothetical protein